MEAAEYLWVLPSYNVKLKSTLKCRIKLIKNASPKVFHAHIERNGL